MSKKTIIDKVKAMFSEEVAPTEVKFLDAVTVDGVAIRVDAEELIEGVAVFVLDEEGNESVAPEGEHTVEDKVITLDENGVIISIVEVEAPAEEEVAEEAPVEEEMEAVEEAPVAEVTDEVVEEVIEEEVNETESRLAAIEKAIADMAHHFSAVTELQAQVTELSGKPADKEIKLSKTSGEAQNKDIFSKLKELSKYRK